MKAAILDMDGLLIDSEPLWRRAEIAVFATVGVTLTDAMCLQTMGLRVDEVVRYWYRRQPWSSKSLERVELEVVDEVERLIASSGRPMPGVGQALELLRSFGLRLAIASSSAPRLIEAVIERLDLGHEIEVRCSAADEERGKPDPAVYLSAARALGVEPVECLALEDSVAGVRSARRAGMTVIAVPDRAVFGDRGFDGADLELRSLEQLTVRDLAGLVCPAELQP